MAKIKKNSSAETIRSTIWTFRFFWRISPSLTFISLVVNTLLEVLYIINTFVFAKGVDILVSISKGDTPSQHVYIIVLLFFITNIFQEALQQLSNYSDRMLNTNFFPKFQQRLYEKLITLGIERLEDPEINNLIDRTRRNTSYIQRVFDYITSSVGNITAILGSMIVLMSFAPHFVPLFVVVLIPSILIDRKFMSDIWSYNRDLREDSRSAYQSSSYLQNPDSLRELVVTSGYTKLSDHFESFTGRWMNHLGDIRKTWYSSRLGSRLVRAGVEAYADLVIFFAFLAGKITLGRVTFLVRQTTSFASSINSIATTINGLYEASLNINEARELFGLPPEEDGENSLPKLELGPEVSISNVSFTYPRSKNAVIKNLSLNIKSGEKIAIVGHNGAGKTTLVKLILRFYKTQEGAILVNNQNLNDLKISDWYKNTSVLFQDYNTYENLTVHDNITVGNTSKKPTKRKVSHAATMADANSFIEAYTHKYQQTLSEKYKGGTRPSTGQWQKLAIARFFYRNAPLVIFDEPTAAIDAVSEAKIFNRIYTFFKGKTVIIISHRFSTVRNADRIIVFDKGEIVEQGTHEELLKLKGKYAEAFNMQAEGYK